MFNEGVEVWGGGGHEDEMGVEEGQAERKGKEGQRAIGDVKGGTDPSPMFREAQVRKNDLTDGGRGGLTRC